MNEATRLCADCGVDISHRHFNAKRCGPCADRRNRDTSKAPTRPPRPVCATCGQKHWPAEQHRDVTCEECGGTFPRVKAVKFCSTLCKKRAIARRHRERNPGYYKQYSGTPQRRAYAEANRKELARKAREYKRRIKAENPDAHARSLELARAWWAANAEKHRLYQSNRRAKKANHPDSVPVSERDWMRLVRRYRGCCAYCGRSADELHMDHVVPLHKGGRHGNVLPTCAPCNLSKSAALLIEWRMRPDRAA